MKKAAKKPKPCATCGTCPECGRTPAPAVAPMPPVIIVQPIAPAPVMVPWQPAPYTFPLGPIWIAPEFPQWVNPYPVVTYSTSTVVTPDLSGLSATNTTDISNGYRPICGQGNARGAAA